MLIITGFDHNRSKAIIKFMKEIGFPVGKKINDKFELDSVNEINNLAFSYIEFCKEINLDEKHFHPYWNNMTLREMLQKVDDDETQLNIYVVKDFRFMLSPKIIEMWSTVKTNLEFLIVHKEVDNLIEKAIFGDIIQILIKLHIPFQLLYSTFNYDLMVEALNKLCYYFDPQKAQQLWKDIICGENQ